MCVVKKWLEAGRRMVRALELRDVAALKLCMLSLGVLLGLAVPARRRRFPALLAAATFAGTYVPLMWKCLRLMFRRM